MCGRYGLVNADIERVRKTFRLKAVDFDLAPRYNIAPGQDIAVILNADPSRLTQARWGLVPHWAKQGRTRYAMINARVETLTQRAAYKGLVRQKRCLVPADSFYEWKKVGRAKDPYRIRLADDGLFAFAGLWDLWEHAGQRVLSCVIITEPAANSIREIHDRMPVILRDEAMLRWLQSPGEESIPRLLKSSCANDLVLSRVSPLINSATHEGPEVIEPWK